MVLVVVPSPAVSLVLLAASLTRRAPRFSNLSAKTTLLATVTPSLVIMGILNSSMTTLRPLGPSVTLTASAKVLIPRRNASRAKILNFISLLIVAVILMGVI